VHAAEAAGFLVHRARDLEGARQRNSRIDQRLDGDDGGRKSALHVAGAPPEELPVPDHAREGMHGPTRAGPHHVDVAVEVHAATGRSGLAPGDDVDARIAVIIAGRAFGAHILDGEPAAAQPRADVFRAGTIGPAGWIDRRKTRKIPRQLDDLLAPRVDGPALPIDENMR
jgi:hypothetical protein